MSSHAISKADGDSFDASRTEGDRTPEAALGLCWLGLCCLVSGAQIKKNFRDLKAFFLPPPLQPNHAKMNFQALAWWNIWPLALFGRPAPEKTVRGTNFLRLDALFIPNAKLRVPVKN